MRDAPGSRLGMLDCRATPITLELLSDAAQAGDAHVSSLLRATGGHLGFVLAGLVSFFNPSAVIVRSGIPGGEDLLLNVVRQRIYERALPGSTHHLQVLPSRFGIDAGSLGAALLAGQGFLGAAGFVAEARPSRR
jgi:predicted NBD/HSP70 family sugar kinase